MTYQSHRDARSVLAVILRDSPAHLRDIIRTGFVAADGLHRNFYEDMLLREDLDAELAAVRDAIAVLYNEQERWRESNRPGAGPAGV